ncbi:MAG: hydantoin racemase [Conexibacter sp.]|nr:hydantoin racemase [Conexibacter sp.]
MTRICFLNPFGTEDFDAIIRATIGPALAPATELEIRHLDDGPRNIDYYVPKHLLEVGVLKAVLQADADGFDAFVIGCCYDPGLTPARELTDMPVIGPLEASTTLARLFGHRFSVVTDHRKAVPELEDRVAAYGVAANCRSIRAINWHIDDMLGDPLAVARDAGERCRAVIERDGAEVAVLGCTIVAACCEQARQQGASGLEDLTIVNPNLMAMKVAELLGDLRAAGQHRISRRAYYQQHEAHDAAEAAGVKALLLNL